MAEGWKFCLELHKVTLFPFCQGFTRPTFNAASTNPRNSGWGLFGLERSSGCACVAIYQGCPGISIISTILPSGDSPHSFIPCSTSTER